MKISYSVIIPFKGDVTQLIKLIESIPSYDDIEIIVVDNSGSTNTLRVDLENRNIILLSAAPERFAGGARNVGIENARGKWLVFADADDYFSEDAFNVFGGQLDSTEDIIYFCATGIYIDSGEYASRAELYSSLVKGYLAGNITEDTIRCKFGVPWAKMINRDFVIRNNYRFDEVVASNDLYFSLLTGYNAQSIKAINKVVYVVTVSRGSLTKRRDFDVRLSRFLVNLRYNQFVREHGLPQHQQSIMTFMFFFAKLGIKNFIYAVKELIHYHQNPFVGYHNWLKTLFKRFSKKDKKYFTK